jgi:predicted transposase YbfD/YdcC
VRGAKAAGGTAPHLVAALDHTAGVVLGQVQVALKSNEIPALRTLLDAFDLVNRVITADAMHTQRATATYITGRGGHYVFTVKANQPGLYRRCKALPWTQIRATSSVDTTHGRRVRRTIKVAAAPQILGLPPTPSRSPSSDAPAPPTPRRASRSSTSSPRWRPPTRPGPRSPPGSKATGAPENKLHWVRDVVFDEDRSTVRTANAPRVMATLRSTAISLLRLTGANDIAKTTRHHARDPARPAKLLLTC